MVLLNLLISSCARMLCLWLSLIADWAISTRGVFMGFWKKEWFRSPRFSNQRKKSSVGNLLSLKSSGISAVNTRSLLTEFMAGKHSLAILAFVVSFSSYFILLSSIMSSLVHVNFLSLSFHLVPNLRDVDLFLTSSTYPSSCGSFTPAASISFLHSSPQSLITILAAAIVTLAPMGPPFDWRYVLPWNL